jgi:hypothetical protein
MFFTPFLLREKQGSSLEQIRALVKRLTGLSEGSFCESD